jgi:hypothetical protein
MPHTIKVFRHKDPAKEGAATRLHVTIDDRLLLTSGEIQSCPTYREAFALVQLLASRLSSVVEVPTADEQLITSMTGELELLRSIVDNHSPGLSDRIRQASETLTQILEGASHEHHDPDSSPIR